MWGICQDQVRRCVSEPSLKKKNSKKAMSCEGCSQKFTVFKRKKLCNICLRYFCSQCLSPQLGPTANNSVLSRLTDRRHICATCLVLTARPLCRLQLKRLKVKDLQHYLTAQRVSTRGCVEKDDLVNLLIRHVGSSSTTGGICNSHGDLSTGHEHGSTNPPPSRPVPPQNLSRPSQNMSRRPQNLSRPPQNLSRPPQNLSRPAAAQSSGNVSNNIPFHSAPQNATSSSSYSSSKARSNPTKPSSKPTPKTSPSANSDDEFEIVELNEDWSGEAEELGAEPLVEEISDSTMGTVSSPTSPCDPNTLSSSTTSLGEPNVTSSSTSSPSREAHPEAGSSVPSGQDAEPMHVSPPEMLQRELLEVRPNVVTLNTIKSLDELERMSVKQIKDLLMRNRVDFRGCCEKTELIERATRLWVENQESKKAFENLGTAEMCKICMDAPIECVMLECGHMATCMSCGKQLNECPLCRQYVVRVVRTFRA